MTTGYEPRFDLDLRRGKLAERYVEGLLLDFGKVEVKLDDRAEETGNVYVEHACKGLNGEFHDSGILVTTARFWAFVIGGGVVVLIPTAVLKVLWQEGLEANRYAACNVGSNPTRGVLIPLASLLKWASAKCRQIEVDTA